MKPITAISGFVEDFVPAAQPGEPSLLIVSGAILAGSWLEEGAPVWLKVAGERMSASVDRLFTDRKDRVSSVLELQLAGDYRGPVEPGSVIQLEPVTQGDSLHTSRTETDESYELSLSDA